MSVESRIALLLSLGLAAAGHATDPANPPEGLRSTFEPVTAFVGATIHVGPTRTLEQATLLVRAGHVAAVGVDLEIPADATVVDLSGTTIYPGFVDPLSEYGQPATAKPERRGRDIQYLRGGTGAHSWNDAVHAERLAVEALAPSAESAKAYLESGFTTVLSIQRDGIFRGRSAVVSLAEESLEEVLLDPLGPHVFAFDKGSSTQAYPGSLMGSIALIRQTVLDAERLHQARGSRATGTSVPAGDLAVEALARDLFGTGRTPTIFETADEASLLRAATIGREFNLPLVLVGSGFEYRRLAEVAAARSTIILPARLPKKPDVGTSDAAHDVSLGDLRHWERAPTNAAALAAAGVQVAFTRTGLSKEDSLLGAVRAAVRHGLEPATALAALTTVPAAIAGVADQLGTLEVGRRADFLVATDELFGSDQALIQAVWIEGRLRLEPNPPKLDLRGTWALRVADLDLELTIKGDKPGAPSGTATLAGTSVEPEEQAPRPNPIPESLDAHLAPDEVAESAASSKPVKATLDGLAVEQRRASFRIDLSKLGGAGVARIGITEGPDGLVAHIERADGQVERAPIERIADLPANPDAKPAPASLVSRLPFPAASPFGFDQPVAAEDVLIRGATIWTSADAGRLENADLLVRSGRIAAVGSKLGLPAGVREIDGAGLHLTAGIIDEHSHLAIDGGVNEGTHPVTSEVRIGDVLDPTDVGIWRALGGGTTSMQLLHGSANPIGGQAEVVKLRWGSTAEGLRFAGAPPSIKFALGENVKQSNWDNPGARYPKTRMGVEARIRDAFLAARTYRDEHAAFARLAAAERTRRVAPRRDLQLEALVEILDGKRIIHCHSYVQSEILSLIRLADEFGFKIGTFTHILEGYKVAPEIAAHGAGASSFADWWAYKFEVYDAIPHNACLLSRAGVLTSINSDSGELIRRLNQEASKSVLYCDMEETAALAMVTINPARQLGIANRVGSLEVGKDADFVIWNGHPLSTLSRVEQTWVDGRPLFTRERDAELRQAAAAERQALIQKVLSDTSASGNGPSAKDRDRRPQWHCDDVHDIWSEELH